MDTFIQYEGKSIIITEMYWIQGEVQSVCLLIIYLLETMFV